jgi:hypothetical protein
MSSNEAVMNQHQTPDLSAAEAAHIARALAKVKDPMMRYFLWLFIDLVTDRIAQLDGLPLGDKSWTDSFATKQ